MKKIFLLAAVASVTLVSCNKDWDCTCTYTSTGQPDQEQSITILNTTKDIAKEQCLGEEDPDGDWKRECELKAK